MEPTALLPEYVYEGENVNNDPKEWLFEWFERNTEISWKEIQEKSTFNYLEQGWIDSLKFVTLIAEIEEYFDIVFLNNEFQDRAFGTLNGLAEAIKVKLINVKK